MSSGSGPMCEEPMWGVALEIEVRLGVAVVWEGEREGGADAGPPPGGGVELQEEVYGPFSGQVCTCRDRCAHAGNWPYLIFEQHAVT